MSKTERKIYISKIIYSSKLIFSLKYQNSSYDFSIPDKIDEIAFKELKKFSKKLYELGIKFERPIE